MATLAEVLEARTAPAAPELVEPISKGRIRCYACGHECPIPEGAHGVCRVRYVRDGVLHVPWGYVGGVQCDPIEKKPFFHARPGALAFSFGMLGCDLHCSYCQNWVTSQALRDPQAVSPPLDADPEALVDEALRLGSRVVVSTYNEPLITSEWGVEIFKHARRAGLMTAYVSNGNGTPQVLEYIRPWIDLYKVDLKSFDDKHYRQLGGRHRADPADHPRPARDGNLAGDRHAADPRLQRRSRGARGAHRVSRQRLTRHPLARHGVPQGLPDERSGEHDAGDAGDGGGDRPRAGLRYVYAGNLPGRVGDLEHTRCHNCRALLVERYGYFIQSYRLTSRGRVRTAER